MEATITNFSDENFSLKRWFSRDVEESEKEEVEFHVFANFSQGHFHGTWKLFKFGSMVQDHVCHKKFSGDRKIACNIITANLYCDNKSDSDTKAT